MSAAYFDWASTSTDPTKLRAAIDHFDRIGYVIFTSFCTAHETASLRAQAAKILHDFHHPPAHATPCTPPSIFTTAEQTRKMDDAYFLASAANVSCFLEERQDARLDPREPAVNKIGHALHDLDPVFGAFSRQAKVREAAAAVGVRAPTLVQSMYILKNPRVGGEVRPHRDATFVRGVEGGCLGYWWALEDATKENGCLWAVPESHMDGAERKRFVVAEGGGKVVFEGGDGGEGAYGEESYVALPMAAGDLVLLHGEVVHKSFENLSEKSRHAYSIHVVEKGVTERCWLQRPEQLPFQEL